MRDERKLLAILVRFDSPFVGNDDVEKPLDGVLKG